VTTSVTVTARPLPSAKSTLGNKFLKKYKKNPPPLPFRVRRVMDPGRVLRGDGLQPPAAAVVGEGRAGAEADGLFAVPDGLDVQRRRGPGFELAVDGVQHVAGRRPCREPPDLAGAPQWRIQDNK
jgi:hypothetical protein